VSNYSGWQQGAVTAWQRAVPGRAPIISNQVEYSLLQRGIEREVVPSALDQGVGLLPWSPLGRGVLTGKYRHGVPGDSRGASQHFQGWMQPFLTEAAGSVVDAVLTAADGLGVSPVAVALSWVRDRPGVTAPIVGARTSAQLQASLAAESLVLPEPVRQALDDVSAPPSGYPDVMARWSSEDIET
jgi:aryl-alcohol dehydrogenase-like predicted oxidoreductase